MLYALGVLLLVLAYRIYRGVGEDVDPDKNLVVRGVRRVFPVTDGFREGHWFVREDGRRHVTPIFLCLAAIVAADIAFAVDSIPAAFAITTDPLIIWAGNVFALLGLRALFVLVEGLIKRFRYLDETIAVVLGLVAVKILIEPLVKIGPVASLGLVAACVRDRHRRVARRRPPRSRGGGRSAARRPTTGSAGSSPTARTRGAEPQRRPRPAPPPHGHSGEHPEECREPEAARHPVGRSIRRARRRRPRRRDRPRRRRSRRPRSRAAPSARSS